MGCMQMGQRAVVAGVGKGTVRIGREVVIERGGRDLGEIGGFVVMVGGEEEEEEEKEERETVFLLAVLAIWDGSVGLDDAEEGGESFGFGDGRPETSGGGRLRPSAALRESCRAKSDACHHSRNLRAKMEVGRRSFKLARRRGYIIVARVMGLRREFVWPGRLPG